MAKLFVEHFVKFKGCERHTVASGDDTIGMQEFINQRRDLIEQIPEFTIPDFAQSNRLPRETPSPEEEDEEENEEEDEDDEWRRFSQDPLLHMSSREWERCNERFGRIFTGGDDSDDEDGVKLNRYLNVGKGDAMFANSGRKRAMARGEVTIDIDSILALFTDLSVIDTVIAISIVANPTKNLDRSIHLIHNGIPLHWIPHFHLGQFGHDPMFDLFMFLPGLYNKNLKRRKNKLFNHVDERSRAEFMDKCLLPAIKSVATQTEKQSWEFKYCIALAKSQAKGLEGNQFKRKRESFKEQLTFDLDEKHIVAVWNECNIRLQREIRVNRRLRAFKGFQFFVNAKGYKHRT
ncbi:MAG TPA: hypothetical protein VKI62_10090, partial [Bacteroidota bacterium]|nr:hypothetical protein [Bacteroidota bacterium]